MRQIGRFQTVLTLAIALLGLGATAAASADAAEWSINNGINAEGKEVAGKSTLKALFPGGVGVAPVLVPKEEFVLKGTVLGAAVEIKANEIGSVIGTAITPGGKGEGKLVLVNPVMTKPAKCTLPKEIETAALKFELVAVAGLASGTAAKFTPAVAGSTTLALVTPTGPECVLNEAEFKVVTTKGLFAETAKKETYAKFQVFKFSPAINKAAGGDLKTGVGAAELSLGTEFGLLGANAGKEWASE
jgi:hypothetical protein